MYPPPGVIDEGLKGANSTDLSLIRGDPMTRGETGADSLFFLKITSCSFGSTVSGVRAAAPSGLLSLERTSMSIVTSKLFDDVA